MSKGLLDATPRGTVRSACCGVPVWPRVVAASAVTSMTTVGSTDLPQRPVPRGGGGPRRRGHVRYTQDKRLQRPRGGVSFAPGRDTPKGQARPGAADYLLMLPLEAPVRRIRPYAAGGWAAVYRRDGRNAARMERQPQTAKRPAGHLSAGARRRGRGPRREPAPQEAQRAAQREAGPGGARSSSTAAAATTPASLTRCRE